MAKRIRQTFTLTLVMLCLAGMGTLAQEQAPDLPAGHSMHGDAFNEGPRQKAYLMKSTGRINFPVTTKAPLAQEFIQQGVGQLHGFWYFEAERSFRQAAALDPDCAMAYWGMAMANTNNEKRAKGFIAEAVKRKKNVSEREAMFIDALNVFYQADPQKNKERSEAYAKALEQIVLKYPKDIEAKAFLAVQFWFNQSRGIPIQSYVTVDALLEEIFRAEPMHPAHHYRIHLWDSRKPENALGSAALCGQSAPGIAHMWHMSGHTFSGLKRYADAAWQQEASARVDHAHMMRDRVMPDQIHNFAHNNEWLIRDLIHVGRVHDALDLAKNMTELPRHPKYNTLRGGSANYGRLRLFQVLNTYELWDELIALAHTPYLEPTDVDAEQIKRLRHLGAAHVRKGDVENGKKTLATLTERLQNEKTAADKAAAEAAEKAKQAGKDEKQIQAAKEEARKPFNSKITDLDRALDELNGHLAIASGDAKNGLALLKKAGGVDAMYLARVRFLAGEKEEAVKDAQSYVKSHPNEVQPLAHLVALLWDAGKKTEATAAFKELREISGTIDDLHAPVFARLAPIAQQSGFPQDWRIFKLPAKDVGNRPPLDSLGPFRWQPSPAPAWKLKDVDDKTFSLKQYRGKPVVVIFYLGHKCLHCNEQLQKFGPMTDEFAKAGISLIAVSSDDANGLKTSLENYKNGAFPFPLVANPELDVFKAYRCYDDFERQPLHGTFVIDGDGLVRWQDISYEPFMDGQFVLNESKRLLEQSQTQKRVARK